MVAVVVLAGGFVFAVRIDDSASVGVGDSDGARHLSSTWRFSRAHARHRFGPARSFDATTRRVSLIASCLGIRRPLSSAGRGPRRCCSAAPQSSVNSCTVSTRWNLSQATSSWGCPIDLGPKTQPTYGLFFNYPDGDVVLVTVATGGCRFASNGHRIAYTNDAVQKQVKSLFHSA